MFKVLGSQVEWDSGSVVPPLADTESGARVRRLDKAASAMRDLWSRSEDAGFCVCCERHQFCVEIH